MQIACEVRRVLAKNPAAVQIGQFRLNFGSETTDKPFASREQAAAAAKAKWLTFLGVGGDKGRPKGQAVYVQAVGGVGAEID